MKRLINWFVDNPIAANLLMVMILVGGVTSLPGMNNAMFPNIPRDVVEISVPYPGAGPREVEQQICMRIEEAISDLDGIFEIHSFANQNSGRVDVEAADGYDIQRLLNNVKSRVDAINTFPADSERPQIREVITRIRVLRLAVFGDMEERQLKTITEEVRDDIARLPGISVAEISGTRDDEVSVEISEHMLRRHQLRFEDIVSAIQRSSVNLPAGQIRASSGDITLQARGQAYDREQFEAIVVLHRPDGTQVRLGEIATVHDGFVEQNLLSNFNGKPAAFVDVYTTQKPDLIGNSESIRAYLAEKQRSLPGGIELVVWNDNSRYLKSRMNLLAGNALGGLVLVFAVLMLFLRPSLAFWVAAGLGVAYLGTLWVMPYFGLTVNVITLFAFLMILGIVVDDAIVVGESVYAEHERGLSGNRSAQLGATAVSKPVTIAVLTTMIVFLPLILLPGDSARFFADMGLVAILALAFSLIESFFILPAHLRHLKPETEPKQRLLRVLYNLRKKMSSGMSSFADNRYQPFLRKALTHRRVTMACFLGALLIVLSVMFGGWMRVSFFPKVEGEFVLVRVDLPLGTSFAKTTEVMRQVESAVEALRREPELLDAKGGDLIKALQARSSENQVIVSMELVGNEERNISSYAVGKKLKQLIGPVPEAEEIEVVYTLIPRGKDINLLLRGSDIDELKQASQQLQQVLSRFPGVYNLSDSAQQTRPEIDIGLRPYAETLGIGLSDVARQVRYAFYGAEAQRIPRLREDVKVMVRYPENERGTVHTLDELRIRTSDGRELPFDAVASADYVPGYAEIKRRDRQRMVEIKAEMQPGYGSAAAVVGVVFQQYWPQIQQQYPDMSLSLEGDQKEQQEFQSALWQFLLLVILAIYALLAIQFRSYWQPVIILSAVPFGIAGAVIGHLLLGKDITMPSMLGVMAAVGVVVNDNLVLIDRINQLRKEGWEATKAVLQGARDRFRPIVLTSFTTFVGLTPILLERSTQAQFLIPMVISLSFGVLFATSVALILVPAIYLAGEGLREWAERLKAGWQQG